jgi:hypothetical protein
MKNIADQLPPEIAQQIHPDRRKNEAAYWQVRDQLLDLYSGQWIGFADGTVIASGSSPVTVFHDAEASGRHPFLICVGKEDEPCRIRRVAFGYDATYPSEALPLIKVEFRQAPGLPGDVLDRTGRFRSVLRLHKPLERRTPFRETPSKWPIKAQVFHRTTNSTEGSSVPALTR